MSQNETLSVNSTALTPIEKYYSPTINNEHWSIEIYYIRKFNSTIIKQVNGVIIYIWIDFMLIDELIIVYTVSFFFLNSKFRWLDLTISQSNDTISVECFAGSNKSKHFENLHYFSWVPIWWVDLLTVPARNHCIEWISTHS